MAKKFNNVVVAGATGFVGLDLVYLLSKHSKVKIINLCAQKNIGRQIRNRLGLLSSNTNADNLNLFS